MTRDVRRALGGSRLLDQPAHRAELDAWRAFLERPGPLLIEVGFDHGRRLTSTARHHPSWRVAGLEIRRRRVDEVRARAEADGLDNLLAWRVDARTVLANHTPDGAVDLIEALFPDPWWKPQHRDRRLVDVPFLRDVARVLCPGGILHLATDVDHVADWFDASLAQVPAPIAAEGAASERPPIPQQSRREWRCGRDGTPVFRRWLRRVDRP